MDKEKAKRILLVYRPDPSAAEIPELEKALRFSAGNPEMEQFLFEEQAFDRAFADKLEEVKPPPCLLGQILKAAPPLERGPENQGARGLIPQWRQHPFLGTAMAACLLLLLSLGIFTTGLIRSKAEGAPGLSLDAFVRTVVNHADTFEAMDFENSDMKRINAFLLRNNTPYPRNLPDGLKALEGVGCLSFNWKSEKVGVVCLKGKKAYNLYVAERGDFAPLPDLPEFAIKRLGSFSAALWAARNQIYVLTVEGPPEDLSPFL